MLFVRRDRVLALLLELDGLPACFVLGGIGQRVWVAEIPRMRRHQDATAVVEESPDVVDGQDGTEALALRARFILQR